MAVCRCMKAHILTSCVRLCVIIEKRHRRHHEITCSLILLYWVTGVTRRAMDGVPSSLRLHCCIRTDDKSVLCCVVCVVQLLISAFQSLFFSRYENFYAAERV